MERSFRNYTLSVASILFMICFVICLVMITREDFNLNGQVVVIAIAILSFFASLYMLMLIKSGKDNGRL